MPNKGLSEEERLKTQKQLLETNRRRKRVREDLWPFLVTHMKSIQEARMFCTTFMMGVNAAFNQKMADIKLAGLNLDKYVGKTADSHIYHQAIEMFKDEDLISLREMVEAFPTTIDFHLRNECKTRPLKDVEVAFMKDIKEATIDSIEKVV